MRISDGSSDVCSSDLSPDFLQVNEIRIANKTASVTGRNGRGGSRRRPRRPVAAGKPILPADPEGARAGGKIQLFGYTNAHPLIHCCHERHIGSANKLPSDSGGVTGASVHQLW